MNASQLSKAERWLLQFSSSSRYASSGEMAPGDGARLVIRAPLPRARVACIPRECSETIGASSQALVLALEPPGPVVDTDLHGVDWEHRKYILEVRPAGQPPFRVETKAKVPIFSKPEQGDTVTVSYDPKSRKTELHIEGDPRYDPKLRRAARKEQEAALKRQALADRCPNPRRIELVPTHFTNVVDDEPLWTVPAACPECGARVDQSIASMAEHLKWRVLRTCPARQAWIPLPRTLFPKLSRAAHAGVRGARRRTAGGGARVLRGRAQARLGVRITQRLFRVIAHVGVDLLPAARAEEQDDAHDGHHEHHEQRDPVQVEVPARAGQAGGRHHVDQHRQ